MIDQMVKYLLKAERKRTAGRRSYSPHSYKLELRRYGRCWITHRPEVDKMGKEQDDVHQVLGG
jgi:hypothetical protein